MHRCSCRHINCIVPPHMLRKLLESKDKEVREAALNTLVATARLRGERTIAAGIASAQLGNGRRTIFDCKHSTYLPAASVVRGEDGPASIDDAVNKAFDRLGTTRDFFKKVLNRDSIDNKGMRLNGYVHRGVKFNNAFWDGKEMVFGDGDGIMFADFTGSIDIIAHELTHGVTEQTAGLEYRFQSGALNESVSDVFGSLVKQWTLQQTADQADWLIGAEVFTPDIDGDALRSMRAPGTAYRNVPDIGDDPQPDNMSAYVILPDTEEGDNGGVHINSGIPNKAFYVAATVIGGFAWEAPGHIWYEALNGAQQTTDFQQFADLTYAAADRLYGTASNEQSAVFEAWSEVGIRITGGRAGPPRRRDGGAVSMQPDASLRALTRQVEVLAKEVKALAKDVASLKGKK